MTSYEAGYGRLYVCRLSFEADLIEALERIAEESRVTSAFFMALGAVKRAALAYYDQKSKKYVEEAIDEPMELLSCIGNIATLEGKTIVHSHAVFSDRSGRVRGGHLLRGTIVFAGEVLLLELAGVRLDRSYDRETGLNLYTPRPI